MPVLVREGRAIIGVFYLHIREHESVHDIIYLRTSYIHVKSNILQQLVLYYIVTRHLILKRIALAFFFSSSSIGCVQSTPANTYFLASIRYRKWFSCGFTEKYLLQPKDEILLLTLYYRYPSSANNRRRGCNNK